MNNYTLAANFMMFSRIYVGTSIYRSGAVLTLEIGNKVRCMAGPDKAVEYDSRKENLNSAACIGEWVYGMKVGYAKNGDGWVPFSFMPRMTKIHNDLILNLRLKYNYADGRKKDFVQKF